MMFDTDQILAYVNVPNVQHNTAFYACDQLAINNLFPQLPALADFAHSIDFNLINCAYAVANENLAPPSIPLENAYAAESFTFFRIQSSPVLVNGDTDIVAVQPKTSWVVSENGKLVAIPAQPESFFDWSCSVVATAVDAIADYIFESERKTRKFWKRFYRNNIRSSGVSKHGHLPFLVPRHEQERVETAARDQVIHLEVITLAEEQEGPGVSAVGQILLSGGESWNRWKKLPLLFSRLLRMMLPSGFTACGLSITNATQLTSF